jgi:hypothetical protein
LVVDLDSDADSDPDSDQISVERPALSVVFGCPPAGSWTVEKNFLQIDSVPI